MKEEEGRLIYGMLTRVDSSLKQAMYYMDVDKKDETKHFIMDAKYTLASIKNVLDKIKFSETWWAFNYSLSNANAAGTRGFHENKIQNKSALNAATA